VAPGYVQLTTHGIPTRHPRIKIINSHLGADRLLLGTDFPS
jgi:hypothetical protein